MGPYIILIIVAVYYCNETYCDTFPTTIGKPVDIGLLERNDSYAIEKEIWENLNPLSLNSTSFEESKSPGSIANRETNKRKSRLLGSLAFLAGLSFGGLATAASSTVNSIAKLPKGSLSLNLGSSNTSPYIAAYYSPYSVLPYPFLYPGSFGFMPMADPMKPQTTSHNDPAQQVISLFDNRRPIDLTDEYSDEDKFDKSNAEDRTDDLMELRAQPVRNMEKKTMIRECKGGQRKHGNSFKGTAREREDLHVNADDSQGTLNFQATNMTANQNMTHNVTTTTTRRPPSHPHNHHHHHHHHHHNTSTDRPYFPGYYGGYPQNVNHVDLTSGSNAYRYPDHSQINYNLPYEQPANFYHDDKYNIYSNPHINPHFSGPFSSDQTNEYTDFNRFYNSEFQQPYANGFRPVK